MLNLTRLPLVNTFHNKSVSVKSTDIVGKGYHIELVDGMAEHEAQKKMLKEFIRKAPERGHTFSQAVKNFATDRLITGNGAIEIARDIKKMPVLFAHVPFYTLQVHEDNIRWCHIVGNESVWFKRYGIEQEYSKKTGKKLDSV